MNPRQWLLSEMIQSIDVATEAQGGKETWLKVFREYTGCKQTLNRPGAANF